MILKGNFELDVNKALIKARYNQNIDIEIKPMKKTIPILLYHGTSGKKIKIILKTG